MTDRNDLNQVKITILINGRELDNMYAELDPEHFTVHLIDHRGLIVDEVNIRPGDYEMEAQTI